MHSRLTVITLIFAICGVDAQQLTYPQDPVCPGLPVVFQCIRGLSNPFRWRVTIHNLTLEAPVNVDSVNSTLRNDPGFGFMIATLSNTSNITSVLRVVAKSSLTGAAVECVGVDGILSTTIQIGNSELPSATQGASAMFICCSVNITWEHVEDASYHRLCLYETAETPVRCLNTTTSFAAIHLSAGNYTATVTTFNQCNSNGTESVPFVVEVLSVDCGAPKPSDNVIVMYSSTLENSTVTFTCKEGLEPNGTFTGICQSSGIWSNDPAGLLCRNLSSADCGVPSLVTNGSINSYTSTMVGAVITYQCDEGLLPSGQLTAVCQSDGTWRPNPADTMCRVLTGAASSPAVPVAIAVVVILVLVVTVTVAVVLVLKVKTRGSKNADSSQFGLELQDTKETCTEYCTTKHPGPRGNQSVTVNTNTLVYAGLDLPSERRMLPSHPEHADNPTSYAEINFAAANKLKEVPHGKSADDSLNLDSLLIQLKPQVTSKWEEFARVVGLSQEVIKDLSNCDPDERMVEMLDYWLRHHPSKPTWKEVAQILEELHLYTFADELLKVYETGELPVPFDMNEVPEGTLPRNEPPPPLPPKLFDLDDGPESPPLVCALPPKPPPHGGLPVHYPPPLPPPYHDNDGSMLPPSRPPKSHSHGMPLRPAKADTVFTAVPALPPKPKT